MRRNLLAFGGTGLLLGVSAIEPTTPPPDFSGRSGHTFVGFSDILRYRALDR
ncbi:hypothetical protein OF122_15370 [Pelagibacterium flavum]|uniref:Uncharacterized protein n=1 Tax=Pelagibacterium flavum TaxID=2984530 RepID=A0ABY6ILD6_9HYPH|nr:hypothetical protein [Pelagibacterium sp. YIM 151497]UYQ71416.1 hypothetical protein OF122_15370 [Pelagibacterium sp. YIM 151497]